MQVEPIHHDIGHDARQLTVESHNDVIRWTGGVFHGSLDPRQWRLTVHVGGGFAADAVLGNWIVQHGSRFEVLTCDEFDRKYKRAEWDRPGSTS